MSKSKAKLNQTEVGKKYGFLSGLEENIANQLTDLSVRFEYEMHKLPFTQPEKKRTYTPDFYLYYPDGRLQFVVESKGIFTVADRQKTELILEQYPNLDLRFVFTRSKDKINKKSKTTYGMWCEARNIKYADKLIPTSWLTEEN